MEVILLGHGMHNGHEMILNKKAVNNHSLAAYVEVTPTDSVLALKTNVILTSCGAPGPAQSLILGRKPRGCGNRDNNEMIAMPSTVQTQDDILKLLVRLGVVSLTVLVFREALTTLCHCMHGLHKAT